MKSKPGSGKRQDCNFEIVVNPITINEDQLPQVSQAPRWGFDAEAGPALPQVTGGFVFTTRAPNTPGLWGAPFSVSVSTSFCAVLFREVHAVGINCDRDTPVKLQLYRQKGRR